MHVWALWLSCETPAASGPPGLHTTARELQTCTFEGPGASNTTKIPRERPKEREKRMKNCGGRGKKKREILGPHPSGPHPSGLHPWGLHPWGLHPWGLHPSGHPSEPHPSGPPLFLGFGPPPCPMTHTRFRNGLAKTGLAKVGLFRFGVFVLVCSGVEDFRVRF